VFGRKKNPPLLVAGVILFIEGYGDIRVVKAATKTGLAKIKGT
jgi:hypothetical protein